MKAEEFRIGNFIDFLGLKIVVGMSYTAAGKFKIEVEHKRPNGFSWREYVFVDSLELNPIPLTEEWLMNFGFYKSGLDVWRKQLSNGSNYVLHSTESVYVHKLQNHFYAVTGEELTLIEKP